MSGKSLENQPLEQGASLFVQNDITADDAANKLEREQSKLYKKIGQLTVKLDFLNNVNSKFRQGSD